MGRLSQYWRYEATLLIASILSAFSFALQGLAGSVLSLGLARALGGLFMGAMLPCQRPGVSAHPPDQRGLAFGVTRSSRRPRRQYDRTGGRRLSRHHLRLPFRLLGNSTALFTADWLDLRTTEQVAPKKLKNAKRDWIEQE